MTPFEQLTTATALERAQLLSNPMIQRALAGQIDRATYVNFLAQAYYHVSHTVPLLMLTGARLPQRLDWMRGAMAHYIEEEQGHELWILQDIAACGADPATIKAAGPGLAAELMVAYAYDSVQRIDPIRMLGMVHVLEGTSVALATTAADALQASLLLPDQAFVYLRSHGTLDLEHVDFFAGLVNRLDSDELAQVIESARRFFWLYGNIFRELEADDNQREAA